ncbi:SMP-30/gluconolactonase/LRE family protein [Pseudomonas sp. RC10]|uniref:SMP-30/gluconolactonase/LRE family protein n=1 Tax=Pseudomonas bambusae TaxID=3139142 RepID=UPI00313A32E9
MPGNPIDSFIVTTDDLHYIGHKLQRPECILAERDGSLWTADARGGVVHIQPDGSQQLILPKQTTSATVSNPSEEASRLTTGSLPNGLAFARNGDIIISNFGTDRLELMSRQGDFSVMADTIDGLPIGKVNFVLRDSKDRIWMTISTRTVNWMTAMSPTISDGYIALYQHGVLRVVAEGFHFTNEIRLDANEEWLYVAETCGMRVTRLRVLEDGSLVDREVFGPSNHNGFIDGITFDAFGNLWGTHIMLDRVFAITPQGDMKIILDDDNGSAEGKALLAAFAEDKATADLMLACGGTVAPWFTSITFGGADLSTVYIGTLRGDRIPYFKSPVAGLPMVHW